MTRLARYGIALAAALTLWANATAALADTRLVYRTASGQFAIDMRPGEVRIDDAGDEWQLYRDDDETIFSVHPGDKSYTRLDENAASTIQARVDALRAQIEERVQQLPGSQRATARAAMLQSIPGLDARDEKIGLERTGNTETVAGVQCETVQVVRDGKPAETLCVANAEALGMSNATFDSVQSMFQLMQTLLAGTGFETAGLPYLNLSGMPVRFSDTTTGERRQLMQISHEPLPDSRFALPGDYIEQAPPAMDE